MRVRTFLVLIVLVLAALAAATFFDHNQEILSADFHYWEGTTLTVGQTLLLFFLAGILITFTVGLARQFGVMLEKRRQRKASRKMDEIEEEYGRALVAILEGRQDDALGHLRAVLERDSRHFNTLLKLGEVLRSEDRYHEAIEYHRKAHHLREEDTRPLYALVEDYEARGDMDRARAVLGKIIGLNKHSVAAWRKLRELHAKEENWDKALDAQKQVEKYAGSTDAGRPADERFGQGLRYQIGADALARGEAKEAVAVFRKLLKEDSGFLPAHIDLGRALTGLGQESEAVQAWYNGFELNGSSIFLTTLEEHYLGNEQPMEAIEALKPCIQRARKDTLPRFYLGKLYFRLEMLDDALAVLSSLHGRASYAPNLHYLLGRIHERRNNHDAAATEYRKVIKEMELIQLEYICRDCGETIMEWTSRCPTCRNWNRIEVNFMEEISLEELGLSAAPIYSD